MRGLFLFLTVSAVLALMPASALAKRGDQGKKHGGGAVYTQTNDPAGNEIVVYKRHSNGSITESSRVATGGAGAPASPPNNFPILDSQGPVELTKNGRLLFAVNAGDDTISAFRVKKRGGLRLVDQEASGGDFPVSIDTRGKLLYVLNELSGDITGFRFNPRGNLRPIPGSTESLSTPGAGGAAAQVGFAPHKRALTVTLRGTRVLDTFRLNRDGTPGPAIANPSTGENPFAFEYRNDGLLVVANAGRSGDLADPTAFQGSASSYALNRNASLTPVDHVAVEGERATCWVVITSNQRYAFMTNTLTNTVSSFRIARDGQLEVLGHAPTGSGFPSDEALSRGSRYLYVLVPSVFPGTMSHIDFYRVRPDGSLTQIGSTPSDLPPGVSGLAAR